MKKKANLSPEARQMLDRARAEARERIVKRGIIQFRADEELVDQLLQIADHRKIPVGVLVRSWVAEHCRQEFPLVPLKDIRLPNGQLLTEETDASTLEDAVYMHQDGKLKLTPRELRTIHDWLLAVQDLERKQTRTG